MPTPVSKNNGQIPTSLASPGAVRFWLAVCLIGASTGLAAAALTRLLGVVQRAAWNGSGTNILETARQASALRHIAVLLAAGILTGAGQVLLKQVPSGNGIDTTAAIWFYAGRMPAPRTPGSALLSIFAVGMGASMGRECAPKTGWRSLRYRMPRIPGMPLCGDLPIFPYLPSMGSLANFALIGTQFILRCRRLLQSSDCRGGSGCLTAAKNNYIN
jgi:hypothetical protein